MVNKNKEYHRAYYIANKERIDLKNKNWKRNNVEKNKLYIQKFREINRQKINKNKREKYKSQKIIIKKLIVDFYNDKDISKYPLKIKKTFARRISRKIKIPEISKCEGCKQNYPKKFLEKHHPDYDQPLEIEMLCIKCHNKIRD